MKSELIKDEDIADALSMSRSWVRAERCRRRNGQPHWLEIDPIDLGGRTIRYRANDFLALCERKFG